MTIAMRRIAGAFIAVLLAVGALTMFTTGSASAYSAGCQTEDAAVVAAKAQYNRDYKPAKRALVQLTRAKKAAHRHHTAAAKKRVKKAQRKFNRALRTVKRDVNRYNVAYGTAFACHNQASGSAYVDNSGSGAGTSSTGTPLDALFAQCAATPLAAVCTPLQTLATTLISQCQTALGATPLGALCSASGGGLPGGLPTDPTQLIAACAATPLAPVCEALGGLLTGLPTGGASALPTDPTQLPGLLTTLLQTLLGGMPGLPTSGLPGLPTGALPTGGLPTGGLPAGSTDPITGLLNTLLGGLGGGLPIGA